MKMWLSMGGCQVQLRLYHGRDKNILAQWFCKQENILSQLLVIIKFDIHNFVAFLLRSVVTDELHTNNKPNNVFIAKINHSGH